MARVRPLALGFAALILAMVATWPMVTVPCTHTFEPGRGGEAALWTPRADIHLTMWILAWDVHALRTGRSLFDANLFHPARNTLALSENMLGALPVYAPIAAVTNDPVCAHQLTLVLTFALAFATMALLVWDWTGSASGAIAAGALFSVSGLRLGQLHALHLEGNYFLPLVLLLVGRLALHGRARDGLLLAVVLVLSTLHSYYLGYAAFGMALLTVAAAIAGDGAARRRWRRLVVAVAGGGLLALVASVPYVVAGRAGVIGQASLELLRLGSARPGRTGATVAAVVAMLTMPWWRRGLRAELRMVWPVTLLVVALAGHALALGPVIELGRWMFSGPFAALSSVVPGWQSFRAPLRLNVLAAVGLSALAGLGSVGVARRVADLWPQRSGVAEMGIAGIVTFGVLLLMVRPVPLAPVDTRDTLPPVYRWLAAAERGPVLELPFHDVERFPFEREVEALRLYRSVYHWHPILNGYSGHVPRPYRAVSALARALPDPRALDLLRRTTGVRYVVLHGDGEKAAATTWHRIAADTRVHEAGDAVVLELPSGPTDLLPRLHESGPTDSSLLGTPVTRLPDGDRRAHLSFAAPPPPAAIAGLTLALRVRVRNVSTAAWPSLAVDDRGLVRFAVRWEDADRVVVAPISFDRVPYDLGPGESLEATVAVPVPRTTGPHRLSIGLAQDGEPFPDLLASDVQIVRPR